MAELLLRNYLNVSTDAQTRLQIFEDAYRYARETYEADLDPAIQHAIISLQESVGREVGGIESHLTTLFSDFTALNVARFLNDLNDATKGGVEKVIGKIATSILSTINKNQGNEFHKWYTNGGGHTAVAAASGIITTLQLINKRLDYQRESSAIVSLHEIVQKYKHTVLWSKLKGRNGRLLVQDYTDFEAAQDLDLYLAMRLCERVLAEYDPAGEDEMAKKFVKMTVDIVTASSTAGAGAIGSVVDFGNELITYLNNIIFSEGISDFKRDLSTIVNEMKTRYEVRTSIPGFVADLYLAPEPPEIPVLPKPTQESFRILPVPDYHISVGETIVTPVVIVGLQHGDSATIDFEGLVSGTGSLIEYTAIPGDIGSHIVNIIAVSNFSGTYSTSFEVHVSGPPVMDLIGHDVIDFGEVTVGGSRQLDAYIVKNSGNSPLHVDMTAEGPFDILLPHPFVLNTEESTTVTIRFRPRSEGLTTCEITFTSNAGSRTNILRGIGLPQPCTPTSMIENITPNPAESQDDYVVLRASGSC